eukprot:15448452-Heterocapsa_arctica.AAC.1
MSTASVCRLISAHDLAATMRHSADAETVNRLSSMQKERDAEVARLTESYQLSAQNLERHQAESLLELRNEMTANNAGSISNLELEANVEFNKRCLVMKAEHVEQ